MMKIRHAMVSKERRRGEGSLLPHGPWHQGANEVKHNIGRALPLPPYWEGIGRHETLIMANPLTIG